MTDTTTEPRDGALYAEVALPLALDQTLTYEVPRSLRDRAAPGMRAIVPLRQRVQTGYIVAVSPHTDVDKVRPLIDLPDDGPIFSKELLELCRWVADYYCCAWGEALQSAVPAGVRMRCKRQYTLRLDMLADGRFSERQRKVIAALHSAGGPLTEAQLGKAAGGRALSNTLRSLIERGVVEVEETAPEAAVNPMTETYVRLLEDAVPDMDSLMALQRRAPKQAAVYLDLLNDEPVRSAAYLYEKHKVDSTILRGLEKRGYIARFEQEAYRAPDHGSHGGSGKHQLNAEQQAAYEAVIGALDAGEFRTFLLKGITGSGKTEVYLQAIEHALAAGRAAIMLVPEISLTPQTVGRLKARFDTAIAVLHSGLGAGERYDEWRRAQRGEVKIVVGARSAVFAPLPNLGLIIVDEEHDGSYKQGDTPRYHARDVAIVRAKLNNGVCVLGSATPSVESFHNCARGKSTCLHLPRRATNALLPEVELVDMRIESKEAAGAVLLSRKLEQAVAERIAAGEQVLLLLNRRGFAPFVLCPQCGWLAECPDCQVSLTFHAKGAFLLCHYCNSRHDMPGECAACGFGPLLYLGTGTQKIEDYLLRAFPRARIERMDADTTAGKGGHAKILGRLAKGEIDILVGTQMIAKGHDYPGVTLVGVLNADVGLALPDFRAAETTFQLLTQVAGRAGRGDKPGRVLIQTYRPNHYAVAAAARHDYDAFYAREIQFREQAAYPPMRRLVNMAIECEDPLAAERAAVVLFRMVSDCMDALGYRGMQLLGPSPATIRRVKKKYRWNLGLLSANTKRLNTVARAARTAFTDNPPPGGAQLKIDFDAYGMF